jgi:hypothetical protein
LIFMLQVVHAASSRMDLSTANMVLQQVLHVNAGALRGDGR